MRQTMVLGLVFGLVLATAGAAAPARGLAQETKPGAAQSATPAPPEAPPVDVPQDVAITVQVSASAQDKVGRLFVEAIREQLRQSLDLALVEDSKDARIRLKVATLDPDNGIGRRTVYSVVVTVRPADRDLDVYWNNYVGLCGQARVPACARNIVDEAGAPTASLRTIIETTTGPAP
ncbi:hypothetical protein AB4Y64_13800 [Lysobacter sp. TAF61]|uniref:hypothetical protein n=1 Tax=Lysobacter sp. TAF61 TaxID=3233072 RepID=UPI003F9B7429